METFRMGIRVGLLSLNLPLLGILSITSWLISFLVDLYTDAIVTAWKDARDW